jgi:hypothetical protein
MERRCKGRAAVSLIAPPSAYRGVPKCNLRTTKQLSKYASVEPPFIHRRWPMNEGNSHPAAVTSIYASKTR